MNNLARNHHHDKKRWVMAGVFKRKKNTCFKKHIASPFLVSWISSLQLELLLNAEKWYTDFTYKACTFFNDSFDIFFIILFVALSPTKEYRFAFITDTKKCIHYQRLSWLKDNIAGGNLPIRKIIINCSQTEIYVAHKVFGESISMLF